MHIEIDKFSHLNSALHRMDARCKLVSFFALAFAISMCRTVSGAGLALVVSIFLTAVSSIPFGFVAGRVKYPVLFLVPLFIFLPLSSGGSALFSIGILNVYYEGIIISIIIFLKTMSIVIIFIVMLSTSSFVVTSSALKSLRVPSKLVNMILFTYRYIFVYFDDLRKMRTALTLRGFKSRNSIRSLKNSASLIGSMLIRSYEQTERIYNAMIMRGYTGNALHMEEFRLRGTDIIFSLLIAAAGALILYFDGGIP